MMVQAYSVSASRLLNVIVGSEEDLEDEYYDEGCCSEDECCGHHDDYEENDAVIEKPPKTNRILDIKTTDECVICMEDDPESLITLSQCKHKVCGDCLANYINFKTGDISVLYHTVPMMSMEQQGKFKLQVLKTYGVVCPAHGCKRVLLESEIARFSQSETIMERFNRFIAVHKDDLAIIEELKRNPQPKPTLSCPRCNYVNEVKKGRRGRMTCTSCNQRFCATCGSRHSTLLDCATYYARLEEFLKKTMTLPESVIKDLNIKRCPNCYSLVQKIDGCQFMTCRCGQNFCNLCGTPIDQTKHYTHFNGSPFGNVCRGTSDKSRIIGMKR